VTLTPLNGAFIRLTRRAEAQAPEKLVETFEDAGALFAQLSSHDHQILYGRRGTGKTHALQYLQAKTREAGDISVYIDLRTIGSSRGVYSDPDLSPEERATRLLIDVLVTIHDDLVSQALDLAERRSVPEDELLAVLQRFEKDLFEIRVSGTVERERSESKGAAGSSGGHMEAALAPVPSLRAKVDASRAFDNATAVRTIERGKEMYRVNFTSFGTSLREVIDVMRGIRVWVLLDEWSDVPREIQPILADMLKRSLFAVKGLTVKIGAIEQRSAFRTRSRAGELIGLELGADVAAGLDLDDFMVFGRDAGKAANFLATLLFKHVRAQMAEDESSAHAPNNPDDMIRQGFTQHPAFEELVRAAEGVPRDAINILNLAATAAGEVQISIPHVRAAARKWYLADKEAALSAHGEAQALLHWVIDEVIGTRRARAFLLQEGDARTHPLIGELYDARVLHVLKQGVADKDRAGVRFNAYQLDYGCYVELMSTARAVQGTLPADDVEGVATYVDVPQDDYRAIRRAILDISEFEKTRASKTATVA
jgi:hypothetical protein